MKIRGPLADSYPGALALVAFSLIPYLALSAGIFPLTDTIATSLGLSRSMLDITIALSSGGYAVGTILAVMFAMHLPARRMLLIYEATFVVASVLTAWSPVGWLFILGFILQGLCTSLMLIAAVPPLVTGWPVKKMPITATTMNLCIFGAVAIGPTVGALQSNAGGWRPLFWAVAGLAAMAFLFSLLTFEDVGPQDASARWDPLVAPLAVFGCGAAFFGAGELEANMSAGPEALAPLLCGIALIVTLVAYQYSRQRPLIPVKALATTVPVTGIFVALMTSAAAFGIMILVLNVLQKHGSARDTALLFLPEFVAAMLIAGVFGALVRTKFTPVLALGGLTMVVLSAVLLLTVLPTTGWPLAAVAGTLGLGVAASVSPALFMAGFSLRSQLLPPVFALIELLRGVAAFLLAPILVFLVGTLSRDSTTGTHYATWICLGIAAFGFVGGCTLYLTGRPRLVTPDLERWQHDGEAAWESPPLFDAVRTRRPQEAQERRQPEEIGPAAESRQPEESGVAS